MLESGEYLVIQEGGEGNALGRIIFRFDNALSIYLHDTSSRDVFALEDRGVSHGCVRVERPYDLALFVMGERGSKVAERIGYSIRADVSALGKPRDQLTDQQLEVLDTLRRDMLIGSVKVEPTVPVYILYYTLYPDKDGSIEEFRDVYGYDKVIAQFFNNLM
jgi:murein L,D-transpeptidase YcbB/YkuD